MVGNLAAGSVDSLCNSPNGYVDSEVSRSNPGADLESAMMLAEKLLRHAAATRGGTSATNDSTTLLCDEKEARDSVFEALESAASEVICVTPIDRIAFDLLWPGQGSALPVLPDGLDVRLAYTAPRRLADSRAIGLRPRLRSRRGPVTVEVVESPPVQALVVDQRILFLRGSDATNWTLRTTDTHLARMLRAFLLHLFTPLPPHGDDRLPCSHRDCVQARAVLQAMSEGLGDTPAARKLGISVRTYRRRVADVLAQLGAETRFQAGLLVAANGPVCLAVVAG
ncbi:helix-turn-helix transcriptional regulator [Nocardia huaxiensis]|uniref:HTH luxR-type domain-containing protein n=1 Tax=Nocardia huaxiensis TaxID=2755382 RepID=A0A7D6ZMZ5_9NOCA|nr:hypothetical protein [Nocardia huaxiensis]QLY33580.1 hypothetical protein H0264_16285 [Nocardia huaxiensis]UFS99503.1 hypothetical protein LPY97_17235 [Nocardia huaxiensis]